MDNTIRSSSKLGKPTGLGRSTSHNARSSTHILNSHRSKNGILLSSGFSTGSRQSIRGSRLGLDRKVAIQTREGTVSIFDDDGSDVTPLSLITPRKLHHKDGGGGVSSTNDMSMTNMVKESVSDVLSHLEQLTTSSWSSSIMGKSASSFSNTSHMVSGSESINYERDDDSSSVVSTDSAEDGQPNNEMKNKFNTHVFPGISMHSPIQAEIDSKKQIHVMLTETDTIVLLNIPSICVSNESVEEITLVKASNAKYKELLESRANNDNFVCRGMQTLNDALKSKDIQATAQKQANAEVMVNQWTIYDTYNQASGGLDSIHGDRGKDNDMEGLENDYSSNQTPLLSATRPVATSSISLVSHSLARGDSVSTNHFEEDRVDLSSSSANASNQSNHALNNQPKQTALSAVPLNLNSARLAHNLALMERAIVGNNYKEKLISYRNLADAEMTEQKRVQEIMNLKLHENQDNTIDSYEQESHAPTLQLLWSYRCELTRGRNVMCMAWNKQNEDIIAVAYGEAHHLSGSMAGLILCWSVKNPEWPERIYTSQHAVTSIDFSRMNPSLLAAGLSDGRIVIYDVRRKDETPVLDNSMNGKHQDPVWELKWVERERVTGDEQSRGETLVSVSTDGRVTQWMVRKGLEFTDLMTLKRLPKEKISPAAARSTTTDIGGKSKSYISRHTGGLCFDFNPKDSNIYLVGTEEGYIHKCSCSYNEQYLYTFCSHDGPVTKVKWSPFLSGVFLSCSSDWTVRLWNQESGQEVFKFQSGRDSVTDIAWSPHFSTCFGSVSSDGRLEIWDLKCSVLDPIISHNVLDRQLTTMLFASQSPTVITGDDNGVVTVYKICHPSEVEKDTLTTGRMDARAGLGMHDEIAQEWRLQNSLELQKVIAEKINAGMAAAGK
ncbi:hypothetical protein BASA60_005920 [Batrachochytrium salamandrivorans]|nr:hypothetical protein BASA60_005920 [Batrachochytrium salamandrivorans]